MGNILLQLLNFDLGWIPVLTNRTTQNQYGKQQSDNEEGIGEVPIHSASHLWMLLVISLVERWEGWQIRKSCPEAGQPSSQLFSKSVSHQASLKKWHLLPVWQEFSMHLSRWHPHRFLSRMWSVCWSHSRNGIRQYIMILVILYHLKIIYKYILTVSRRVSMFLQGSY